MSHKCINCESQIFDEGFCSEFCEEEFRLECIDIGKQCMCCEKDSSPNQNGMCYRCQESMHDSQDVEVFDKVVPDDLDLLGGEIIVIF